MPPKTVLQKLAFPPPFPATESNYFPLLLAQGAEGEKMSRERERESQLFHLLVLHVLLPPSLLSSPLQLLVL